MSDDKTTAEATQETMDEKFVRATKHWTNIFDKICTKIDTYAEKFGTRIDLTKDQVRRFGNYVKFLIFGSLMSAALLVGGFLAKNESFTFAISLLISIWVLVAWWIGSIIIKLIDSVKKPTPQLEASVKAASSEAKKFVSLLILITLVMAFVAFCLKVYGISALSTHRLWVVLAAVYFFAIFALYTGSQRKIAGALMAVAVVFMIGHHLFPEIYRSSFRLASAVGDGHVANNDRKSINEESDASATFAEVISDQSVYQKVEQPANQGQKDEKAESKSDKELPVLFAGELVRVLNVKEVITEFGEPLVKIQLSNKKGFFVVGSREYLFPIRALKFDFKVASDLRKVSLPENYRAQISGKEYDEQILPIEMGKVLPRIIKIFNGDKFTYNTSQEFVVVFNPGTNREKKSITHPACSHSQEWKSFHFYDIPPEGTFIALGAENSGSSNIKFIINKRI